MARDEGPQLRNRLRTTRVGPCAAAAATARRTPASRRTQSYSGSASCQPKLIAIRSRSLSMVA
jgi:hypothetical protein